MSVMKSWTTSQVITRKHLSLCLMTGGVCALIHMLEWQLSCTDPDTMLLCQALAVHQVEQTSTHSGQATQQQASTCQAPMEVLVGAQGCLPVVGSPMQPGFWYCGGPVGQQSR